MTKNRRRINLLAAVRFAVTTSGTTKADVLYRSGTGKRRIRLIGQIPTSGANPPGRTRIAKRRIKGRSNQGRPFSNVSSGRQKRQRLPI
jgi:hypothetical protein